MLEVGELEDASVSFSSPLSVSVSEALFLCGSGVDVPLATASLMWAGTRTQANVRS